MPQKPKSTSWDNVAGWYDEHLEKNEDTYQRLVLLPNLLRALDIKKGERILDLASGQGFFAREFFKAGAAVTGADISEELIRLARKHSPKHISFFAATAHRLSFARNSEFDAVVMVLALQNIENISEVFCEVARVLAPGGRFVIVLNHPAYRIPRYSSWGWDAVKGGQYRRIDRYLSQEKIPITMHPGQKNSAETISYHRSLQDIAKPLLNNGFFISRLEEWVSHKKSGAGPRQKAEDLARREFPLFLMLAAKKANLIQKQKPVI